ncbi:hypothetical protein MMC07_004873 [Pseudocyphellaria aurata]|nr:hypothetical protein [Pseudocyphellaria aurata]
MTAPTEPDHVATLQAAIRSITILIQALQQTLQASNDRHLEIKDPPNPLALLSDASKILKAQTTKLSLLVLNKPYTPSAISFVLNDLSGGCLPGLLSAFELCPSSQYTRILHQHIQSSLSKMMMGLLSLVASIPRNEHGIENVRQDVLASTGVVWADCDKMVLLASTGLVELVRQRVEEWHCLLKDAIKELEEWDPDEEEMNSDTDSHSSTIPISKSTPVSNQSQLASSFEDLSLSPILVLRKRTLAILRTIRVLYPALQKRRVLTFPNIDKQGTPENLPTSSQINGLDSLVSCTQQWTEAADEIAGSLYEGDEQQVEMKLSTLCEATDGCVKKHKQDWNGKEDEFAAWADKWAARLEELRVG